MYRYHIWSVSHLSQTIYDKYQLILMVIYCYVDRIDEFLLPPIFLYNVYSHEKL